MHKGLPLYNMYEHFKMFAKEKNNIFCLLNNSLNNRKHKFFNVKHHHQPLEKKCFHKYLKCECFRMNKNIFLKNFFF